MDQVKVKFGFHGFGLHILKSFQKSCFECTWVLSQHSVKTGRRQDGLSRQDGEWCVGGCHWLDTIATRTLENLLSLQWDGKDPSDSLTGGSKIDESSQEEGDNNREPLLRPEQVTTIGPIGSVTGSRIRLYPYSRSSKSGSLRSAQLDRDCNYKLAPSLDAPRARFFNQLITKHNATPPDHQVVKYQ